MVAGLPFARGARLHTEQFNGADAQSRAAHLNRSVSLVAGGFYD